MRGAGGRLTLLRAAAKARPPRRERRRSERLRNRPLRASSPRVAGEQRPTAIAADGYDQKGRRERRDSAVEAVGGADELSRKNAP